MTPLTMFITIGILGMLIAFCFLYIHFSNKKSKNTERTLNNSQNNKEIIKKKVANNNYLTPLPTVFTKKYNDEQLNDSFEKEFGLNSYKLPDGFIDFCNSNKVYSLGEETLDIYPLKFTEIIKSAKNLLLGSGVFCIPPHCIPFCDDESGGHVYYCLDYNLCGKQSTPRVIYVDNEFIDFDNYENINEYNFNETIVANSFDEFLEKIKEVKY